MRTKRGCRARETWIAGLVLGLLAAEPVAAGDGGCASPKPWSDASFRHGQPQTQVDACLRAQAWETRNLKLPISSVTAGIVAQCEVRVVFLEGPQGSDARFRAQRQVDANDREASNQALAYVLWSRRCVGE